MKYFSFVLSIIGLYFFIYSAFGMLQPQTQVVNWRQLAIQDLEKAHSSIRDIHPGVVDQENTFPHFNTWFKEGYEQALERANEVKDVHGYEYVLRYYLNGYQDRHVGLINMEKEACTDIADRKKMFRWPGFVVSWQNGTFTVYAHSEQKDEFEKLPPIGAELIACNGIAPQEIMLQNVFPFYGNPQFEADWQNWAPYVLIDQQNPWAMSIEECTFLIEDQEVTFPLEWQPVTHETFALKDDAQQHIPFEKTPSITYFDDDCAWVKIPSFYMISEDEVATMDKLLLDIEALRSKRIIVLDIRGNSGGGVRWGDKILLHLFGTAVYDTVKQKQHGSQYDEYRMSSFLMDAIQKQFETMFYPENLQKKVDNAFAGFKQAYKDNKDFFILEYTEVDQEERERPEVQWSTNPVTAAVYFLTDGNATSASLSFADLCIGMPEIIHIGRPTGGDTVFTECYHIPFESNNFKVMLPTIIRRNRVCRKNNECYMPRYVFNGDIRDTQALQQWVKQLNSEEHTKNNL